MRAVNVPIRLVLALPVATPLTDRLMLLYLTVRKTGRSYRQPVSYVRRGNVLLTPRGSNGSATLRPDAGRIRLRGRDVLARPETISELDEIEHCSRSSPQIVRSRCSGRYPVQSYLLGDN